LGLSTKNVDENRKEGHGMRTERTLSLAFSHRSSPCFLSSHLSHYTPTNFTPAGGNYENANFRAKSTVLTEHSLKTLILTLLLV